MQFVVVRKPRVILTSAKIDDLPEIDELPCSLPPIRSISNHIDIIPGASLPNKVAYRLTSQENEEVKR